MFARQREKGEDAHIIALVELDTQKVRVHIILSREAIRKRLREPERPLGITTGNLKPFSPVG
jgi:hypothetical protein